MRGAWPFSMTRSTSHHVRPSWWRPSRIKVMGTGTGAALWAAVTAAAAALAACGTSGVAAAARGGSTGAVKTLKYYAFDINNGTTDPGFIRVPGTNPRVFAQGDELTINDQLTTTHQVNGGYPIVSHDAGVCTLTRIPEKNAHQTLANCVVTAAWNDGSLTIQGVWASNPSSPNQPHWRSPAEPAVSAPRRAQLASPSPGTSKS